MIQVFISSNIVVRQDAYLEAQKLKNIRVVGLIQSMALRVLKNNAPVHTGRFRNSIRIARSKNRIENGTLSGFVVVRPFSYKTKYIINRTKASPGAYVRSINRRIKAGRHPGTRANAFIKTSKLEIKEKANVILKAEFGSAADIKRYLR